MAAYSKGTKLSFKGNAGNRVFLRNFLGWYDQDYIQFPNNIQYVQTYYGNESGAYENHKDRIFLDNEYIGVATGEVFTNGIIEYQVVDMTVMWREDNTVSAWYNLIPLVGTAIYVANLDLGPGNYSPIHILGAVATSEVTETSDNTEKVFQEALNPAAAAAIQKQKDQEAKNKLAQELLKSGTTPLTGNSSGSSNINITNIVIYVFAFLGLIIGGVLWWKGKQNKASNPKSQ
jgi:hypothetical protein